MNYSEIQFTQINNQFKSNLEADYACFAIWKIARPYLDKIRELLNNEYEVLGEVEVHWSEKYFKENAARLYELPLFIQESKNTFSHAGKIGGTSFILFIVKDRLPNYSYAVSSSKIVELTNLNIAKVKKEIRGWIEKDTKASYGIHSTNNIYEFYYQIALLLGVKELKNILNGEKLSFSKIEKDLEGAGGWSNYESLFEVLNYSSNYLVQRGFETLPKENPEKDIDFLTDDFQRLATVLNIRQDFYSPYKGKVKVNKELINIDLRFIGDNYYNTSWSKAMMNRKIQYKGIYIPRKDDYFFSLLFHAKVQKPNVKPKYYSILATLAEEMQFEWYSSNIIDDNIQIGEVLGGYYRANGYYYENPLDEGVFKNIKVIHFFTKAIVFDLQTHS